MSGEPAVGFSLFAEPVVSAAPVGPGLRRVYVPFDLPPAEFTCLCREFAAALLLARRRIKQSDAFDVAELQSHLQQRLRLLP